MIYSAGFRHIARMPEPGSIVFTEADKNSFI